MRPSIFVPVAVFAHGALGFSLASRTMSANTAESANITNFAVTIKGSVVIGEQFVLRPQNVTCKTVQNFTLPAWLPPAKCSDPSYAFSIGREENQQKLGWVVKVNHTLAEG